MNIKPMLARLQSAMGSQDSIEQMVLLSPKTAASDSAKSTKSVNLVVGYNSSPSSQTALDITLWIAHQTRLVTQKQVTVHVVYVVDDNQSSKCPDVFNLSDASSSSLARLSSEFQEATLLRCATPVITQPKHEALAVALPQMTLIDSCYFNKMLAQKNSFEQADRILWQARSLAQEWGGPFNAHLRFGCVSTELRKVVESEAAALLFLGCNSVNHPIVKKLGSNFPCSVLGIPTC